MAMWRIETETGSVYEIRKIGGEWRMSVPIIATHSPILLAFPGGTVLSLDGGAIEEVDYRETDHFRVTREFLQSPERYFKYLFSDLEEADEE